MKKLMYVAMCILVFGCTACSSDDGNGNCRSCTNGPVSISVCDNGDGTFSVEGGPAQEIPAGSSFDEQFDAACAVIGAN